MLAPSVTALAVAASSGVLDSIVEQGVNLRARQSNPRFSFDPNTSSYCTFWYDNDGSIPCTEILGLFSVSIDDFIRWVSENDMFLFLLRLLKLSLVLESFGYPYMR